MDCFFLLEDDVFAESEAAADEVEFVFRSLGVVDDAAAAVESLESADIAAGAVEASELDFLVNFIIVGGSKQVSDDGGEG